MSEFTLEQLYEMQCKLDARIIEEKGLEGQDLLPNTILALQVEIAELANEWRGFKHWSNDREPRIKEMSVIDLSKRFNTETGENIEWKNPLLEEYVDCLHFFLSIARQIGIEVEKIEPNYQEDIDPDLSTTRLISILISKVTEIPETHYWSKENYLESYSLFRYVGERLGLTWEQITAAYMDKNKVNHERQANGY